MGGHGHHPYSPAELELPGFVPQRLSQGQILAPFVGTAVFSILGAWLISGRCGGGGRLSRTDRLLMGWWVFTALTHMVFEPPFLFTPDFISKENPNFFDEMFKEYSKGDSRYASRNTVVLALEVITIGLKGPASLLAVYAIASRKSYSHILQFAVSLSQLYGCLLYFITAYLDGFNFWVSPFYFWAYFIGSNSSWVIIPTFVATRSWKKISAAFQAEKVKTDNPALFAWSAIQLSQQISISISTNRRNYHPEQDFMHPAFATAWKFAATSTMHDVQQ